MLKTAEPIEDYRATLGAIGLVVVIGALLRFYDLGSDSLWLDEAVSWTEAKDSLADLVWRSADDSVPHPPLFNLSLFAAIKLFGDSEWDLRLPSAIFGVANILALYWLGTMTVGRTAGLLGAVLLALSPFHLSYSQEARMYSLLSLTATLYAATCFRYLRTPSLWCGTWVSLAGLALVYSHPYGALNWIAIVVAITVFFLLPAARSPPKTMLVWATSNVIVAAGFMPWALILAGRAQIIAARGFWTPTLTAAFARAEVQAVAGGRLLAPVILIGVVLGVVGRLRRDVGVLCVWIVAPVAIVIVASILSTPVFISRYAIGSLPPLLLLSAFGWTKYAKDRRGVVLSSAVVAIAVLRLVLHNPYQNVKDDWRGVASYLDEREQAADCVLVVPPWLAIPLNYYRRTSSCQWGALKTADLPAEMPASVLFGIFQVTAADLAAFTEELGRRGWGERYQADFRGIRVVAFSR